MKKFSFLKRFTLIIIFIFCVLACVEEDVRLPNASFKIFETTGGPKRANELGVEFRNYSNNATRYNWDFGDGSSSTETSPTHYYQSNGVYTVTLTAYNKNNEPASTSKEHIVNFGTVVFYITSSSYGSVGIYPDQSWWNSGYTTGNITSVCTDFVPECWQTGCHTYTWKAGTYTYYAESCSGGTYTSQYQVIADECTTIKIY
jgi:PKD repeat protein